MTIWQGNNNHTNFYYYFVANKGSVSVQLLNVCNLSFQIFFRPTNRMRRAESSTVV
jgi:hypothetical protein